MKVVERGHGYFLHMLDCAEGPCTIGKLLYFPFVKRIGAKYPGNTGSPHPGTICQEVFRMLIDRIQYLNQQEKHWVNWWLVLFARLSINLLEYRAAKRHGRRWHYRQNIEGFQFDPSDGHIHLEAQQQ